jgi:predicted dithiol-disulfide oxidoreductase (DUF899 family)
VTVGFYWRDARHGRSQYGHHIASFLRREFEDKRRGLLEIRRYIFLPIPQFLYAGGPSGCPCCSFGMDHRDGALVHLAQRDVTFTATSRAPFPRIAVFKKRMGWRFNWVSSYGSDLNYD